MNETMLYDIPTMLEEEIMQAKALSELMRICYTAACGHRFTNTSIDDIQDALRLMWEMLNKHTDKLKELTKETYDIYYKYKNVAGTAV